MIRRCPSDIAPSSTVLARLRRDVAGNVLALFAAALFPLLALLGGGIDMGRAYLAQSRLQQACDSGVLASRKRLGTASAITGSVPEDVASLGQRFFNLNFREGQFGTAQRTFQMALEHDFAVSGTATVNVPTTLMAVFGYDNIPLEVTCAAQLSMANTDIMMVLDVTGSMALTNPGDDKTRMQALKDTVASFHAQMGVAAPAGTRLRFGFVPYSTNVNVGALLQDDWVVDDWRYQSRDSILVGNEVTDTTYNRNWTYVSGSFDGARVISTYPATWHDGSSSTPPVNYVDDKENVITSGGGGGSYYTCDTPAPENNYTNNDVLLSSTSLPFTGPPSGTQTVERRRLTENGTLNWISLNDATCQVQQQSYANLVHEYERVTEPQNREVKKWRYRQMEFDVRNWRTESNGCIEERDTYRINNYDAVDLNRALDLNIDLEPSNDDATKWRPMMPWRVYARAINWDSTGTWVKQQRVTEDEYMVPAAMGLAACPAAARKLAPMTTSDLDGYLATLVPNGATYHDIGMIWGGRLLSPTGIFAAENADVSSATHTSRHMIFLTDGETAPLDAAYSSYGLEPLDNRRWQPGDSHTLAQTVENRFAFACNEVKKKNITVWVISFGTDPNTVMQECSGIDRYFVADNAEQLETAFTTIARRMGDLRISQ